MSEQKRKAGRPSLKDNIDVEMVKKLSQIMCTPQEIAYIIEKGRASGKMALRRKQFEVAMTGNSAAMLIWLGKNWLNQQENPISEDDAKTLPWNDDLTI